MAVPADSALLRRGVVRVPDEDLRLINISPYSRRGIPLIGIPAIAQVWRDAINTKNNAIRLLLIVDYIFNWARDDYHKAVIWSLRKLAVSDSKSLTFQDSVTFSVTERLRT